MEHLNCCCVGHTDPYTKQEGISQLQELSKAFPDAQKSQQQIISQRLMFFSCPGDISLASRVPDPSLLQSYESSFIMNLMMLGLGRKNYIFSVRQTPPLLEQSSDLGNSSP